MPFGFPTVFVTKEISKGPTISTVYVTVLFTGDIVFKITADGGTTWDDITLTTDTRTSHTFTVPGTDVRFMAIGNPDAIIASTRKANGAFDQPGIKIELTE